MEAGAALVRVFVKTIKRSIRQIVQTIDHKPGSTRSHRSEYDMPPGNLGCKGAARIKAT